MYPRGYEAMKKEITLYQKDMNLESIKCPTLIVHGDCDKDVPCSQAEAAHAQISGSELRIIEGGMHMLVFHRDGAKIRQDQVDFVKKHNDMA